MMPNTDKELYSQLAAYTLSHPDPSFIHQHIVDAFAVQQADENTKPIKLTFALVGLYLFLEKNFTGRQVQMAHIKMGKYPKTWPKFKVPENRGDITAADVLNQLEGEERDLMIKKWCQSVWQAYQEVHSEIRDLVKKELGTN